MEVVAGGDSRRENVAGRTHCSQGEPLKCLQIHKETVFRAAICLEPGKGSKSMDFRLLCCLRARQ